MDVWCICNAKFIKHICGILSGSIMSEWRKISIRRELIDEIEKLVRLGRYRSIAEFVSEAIRLRLEQVSRSTVLMPVQNR